jgi:cysteine desulfurase
MKLPVYLDYASTTPVDPRVAAQMAAYLTTDGHFGNPAATSHIYGRTASTAVEEAREQVAGLLNASASEIIWTSGATEAINLGLKGAAQLYQGRGRHIVTVQTEHKAVLDTCQELEKNGFEVTYLKTEPDGLLSPEKFAAALREDTIMAAVMHLNNESGVLQDISTLAKMTAERGILFFLDAAQSNGKLPLDVTQTPVDLISLSAHKVYGPKGIGALYMRRKPRVRVAPQIHGGGQEQGMRSGTLATHQIIGMGTAFALAAENRQADFKKLQDLRARFLERISPLVKFTLNGSATENYPGILNLSFPQLTSADFISQFPDLAVSAGSACMSKGVEPSYVLRAMGKTREEAQNAVRFSFGRFTTQEEMDFTADCVSKLAQTV